MPKLSNELIRKDSMLKFLQAMSINSDKMTINSTEEFFCFRLPQKGHSETFVQKLQNAIQHDNKKPDVKHISFVEIMKEDILNASCENEINRKSCLAILETLQSEPSKLIFSQESGCMEISFPSPVYASLFKLLKYSNLNFTEEGKARLDIKKYLAKQKESIVHIRNSTEQAPQFVFLNSSVLENKIFYAKRALEKKKMEIRPFFFVPKAISPPHYHLVFDVSGSMETSLEKLKKSAIKLVNQLFDFQPEASVSLTTFSSEIKEIGTYKKSQLNGYSGLIGSINALKVEGTTELYQTTLKLLSKFEHSSYHNNVLLFTDGVDNEIGADQTNENNILSKLKELSKNSNLTAKNKFTVLSYEVTQTNVIRLVAKTFDSDVIETDSPDFLHAIKDPQVMKKWAAARSLFKTSLTITSENVSDNKNTYNVLVNHCGQLVELNSSICRPGDKLDILVEDGDGNTIVKGSKVRKALKNKDKKGLHQFGLHAPTEKTDSSQSQELPFCKVS